MKSILSIIFLFPMLLCSQESPFHYKEAEFPGGTQAMRRHVQDNLKYPKSSEFIKVFL